MHITGTCAKSHAHHRYMCQVTCTSQEHHENMRQVTCTSQEHMPSHMLTGTYAKSHAHHRYITRTCAKSQEHHENICLVTCTSFSSLFSSFQSLSRSIRCLAMYGGVPYNSQVGISESGGSLLLIIVGNLY